MDGSTFVSLLAVVFVFSLFCFHYLDRRNKKRKYIKSQMRKGIVGTRVVRGREDYCKIVRNKDSEIFLFPECVYLGYDMIVLDSEELNKLIDSRLLRPDMRRKVLSRIDWSFIK